MLPDLISGSYDFVSYLDLAEIWALLNISLDGVGTEHLRHCGRLMATMRQLAASVFELSPDQIYWIMCDVIQPHLNPKTRSVLRTRLSLLQQREMRCLITKLCQLPDDHDESIDEQSVIYLLELITAHQRPRLQIVYGAAVRFQKAMIFQWAISQLKHVDHHFPELNVPSNDCERIHQALASLEPSQNWSAEQIVALIDTGYEPSKFCRVFYSMVESQSHQAIKALLDCVFTVELLQQTNQDSMNPVGYAADLNDQQLLKICLNFLSRFEKRQIWQIALAGELRQMTPLILATYRGHVESVQILLDFIPSILREYAMTQVDFRGRTAIHWAAYNGHERVLRMLLEGCETCRVQLKVMAMVDIVVGGHRPDQYRHLTAKIRHIFHEIQEQGDNDAIGLDSTGPLQSTLEQFPLTAT